MNEVIDVAPAPVREVSTTQAGALAPTTPSQLLALAAQNGASIEQMERMMALAERLEAQAVQREARDAQKAYVAAMAEFKKNPPQIFKDKHVYFRNSKGGETSYDHATLGEVCDKVIAGLAAHGFSHRWDPEFLEGRRQRITCVITHKLGHSEATSLEGPPDESGGKNTLQAEQSTRTYLERHSLLMACGLATKDMPDDDGAGADQVDIGDLLAQLFEIRSDEAALAFWQANRESLKHNQDAYDRFKNSVAMHRRTLAGAKP